MAKKIDIETIPYKVNLDTKQVYVTGALGGFTDRDFRLILFNDTLEHNEKPENEVNVIREICLEAIMSPQTVKELYSWLGEHIKNFEDDNSNKTE